MLSFFDILFRTRQSNHFLLRNSGGWVEVRLPWLPPPTRVATRPTSDPGYVEQLSSRKITFAAHTGSDRVVHYGTRVLTPVKAASLFGGIPR